MTDVNIRPSWQGQIFLAKEDTQNFGYLFQLIEFRDGYQITEDLKIPLFSQIKRMEILA